MAVAQTQVSFVLIIKRLGLLKQDMLGSQIPGEWSGTGFGVEHVPRDHIPALWTQVFKREAGNYERSRAGALKV